MGTSSLDQVVQRSSTLNRIDRAVTFFMARHGLVVLRIALGVVFFWFCALKLFDDASPATSLIRHSVTWWDPAWFVPFLGVWEMLIGLGLVFNVLMRITLLLLFLQMPGTLLPTVMVPGEVWQSFPFVLTLEGQYMVKNFVLIGAALVLGGTVRGGYLDPDRGSDEYERYVLKEPNA